MTWADLSRDEKIERLNRDLTVLYTVVFLELVLGGFALLIFAVK